MVVQEPVQATIWHCLTYYAYQDAIFLAERLHAEVASEETLFLLATCYFRSGKPNRAYALLTDKGCRTPQCKYLLARCCLQLKKYSEGETILAGSVLTKQHTLEEIISEYGELSCFVLSLLGKILSKSERQPKASECYRQSLKLNPCLWSSFEALCHLGNKPDADKIFQVSSMPNLSSNHQNSCPIIDTENLSVSQQNLTSDVVSMVIDTPQDSTPGYTSIPLSGIKPLSEMVTPDIPIDTHQTPDASMGSFALPSAPMTTKLSRTRPRVNRGLLGQQQQTNSPLTPSFGFLPLDTPTYENSSGNYITPSPLDLQSADLKAPAKKVMSRKPHIKPPVFSMSGNTKDSSTMQTPSPQTSGPQVLFQTHGLRRSSRLFSNANTNSVKENTTGKRMIRGKSMSKNVKGKTKSKPSKPSTLTQPSDISDIQKPDNTPSDLKSTPVNQHARLLNFQKASAEGLMSLLRDIGKAYSSLCQFDCRKAITQFTNLMPHHYNTGWVLSQVGKARFEVADYQQAVKLFKEVRRIEPHRTEGTALYSTALWHLQKEVALSSLAQELTEFDKACPDTWCASGNCFSLQKEHDIAIKFFQRAIQVDPDCAYAYILLGHEYVSTEELDKAMCCFRSAIRIDPRHYIAWYGTGMIYYKQEKFSLAEVHFKKALNINPQSPVLMCHVGVVLHALQRPAEALEMLKKALHLDPNNALCKFRKASILFAMERYQAALDELEELKQIIPKESLVYFLMGKVYKKLGQTHLALMNFSWATDLDPKGANNQIKEAIDKRYLPDEDDPVASMDLPEQSTPGVSEEEGPLADGSISLDSLAEDPERFL
ncbi:cell division cycle protein 27 homolog isoform X2 [Anneissia japonica]|uniref:cell division cycle protein 27 homolog isoform X2 n=1 Tax=Anneissia japonica TaxID=1529436 RepID=UPI001425A0E9|nr:cell division cycle protein 27 homolog isoform X2 [Anneissia japonica]